MIPFIFLFTSLAIMSYMDFKKKIVKNHVTFGFIIGSMFFAVLNSHSGLFVIPMVLTLILAFILWNSKVIGGADVKVLVGMAAFMSFMNVVLVLIIALVLLLIFTWKDENIGRVPFIPLIFMAYTSQYIFNNIFI